MDLKRQEFIQLIHINLTSSFPYHQNHQIHLHLQIHLIHANNAHQSTWFTCTLSLLDAVTTLIHTSTTSIQNTHNQEEDGNTNENDVSNIYSHSSLNESIPLLDIVNLSVVNENTENRRKSKRKKHSEILTNSPIKEVLEKKREKQIEEKR